MEKGVKGFGVVRRSREWAKMLDMSHNLFLYYTDDKRLTVEELFDMRRLRYEGEKERKQRTSERMEDTRHAIFTLLMFSGYVTDQDIGCVSVRRHGNNGVHQVAFNDSIIGAYSYRTHVLRLSGGSSINLANIYEEDARIVQDNNGAWDVHPEVKTRMLEATKASANNNKHSPRAQISSP